MAKSRLALSTVVTTLIVLVVAVLLAGVVVYLAINVTSTRVQQESLALAKQHVWFDYSTGKAQAAIMVINAGGRDVVVDKLTVRGQVCDWSKVFYNVTGESISSDLVFNSTLTDGGTISVNGSNHVFKQATNDLIVKSGKTLIIYIYNPDSISVNDVGLTVSINIFTSQAMYYKEANVQGTSGTQTVSSTPSPTSEPSTVSPIELPYARPIYDSTYATCQVAFVLINSGSTDETIVLGELLVNGQTPIPLQSLNYYTGTFTATDDLPYYNGSGDEIQGNPLTRGNSFTIHPGETAIAYYLVSSDSTSFGVNDIGDPISIGVMLDNEQTLTTTVQVIEFKG